MQTVISSLQQKTNTPSIFYFVQVHNKDQYNKLCKQGMFWISLKSKAVAQTTDKIVSSCLENKRHWSRKSCIRVVVWCHRQHSLCVIPMASSISCMSNAVVWALYLILRERHICLSAWRITILKQQSGKCKLSYLSFNRKLMHCQFSILYRFTTRICTIRSASKECVGVPSSAKQLLKPLTK